MFLLRTVSEIAKKSGLDHLASAAHAAKALKDIIKAFMKGGWHAAALQALKHYWSQILAIALILVFLPVLIYCCLPSILFGFGSSQNAEVSSMNAQAKMISGYYERYPEYCNIRVKEIKDTVTGNQSESSGGDDTVHHPGEKPETYKIILSGKPMEKEWFIALYSVSTGNNLSAMNEQSVKDFVAKSIVYTIEDKAENIESENAASGTVPADGSSESSTEDADKILTIQYLTPQEFMTKYQYSDADRNWAQLLYHTMKNENNSAERSSYG